MGLRTKCYVLIIYPICGVNYYAKYNQGCDMKVSGDLCGKSGKRLGGGCQADKKRPASVG